VEWLNDAGLETVVVGPMPRYESSLPRLLFFGGADNALSQASLQSSLETSDRVIGETARASGALYISLLDLLCSSGECTVYAKPNVPLQFDYVHLTTEGSLYVVERMMPRLDTLRLAEAAQPTGRAPEVSALGEDD